MTTLEQLPERADRLESQFLLLRAEIRDECSATRDEMRAIDVSRAETRVRFEQVSRLDAANATRNKPRRSKKP